MARARYDPYGIQIDRIDDDGGVDTLRHLASDQRCQLARLLALLAAGERVPAGRRAIQEFVDGQRRAEVYIDAAVDTFQVPRRPEERGPRLALLRVTLELGDEGASFEQLLVAEMDRHQEQRP